jgi:hypothetical protein
VDSLESAVVALQAVVSEGLGDGTISEAAAREIEEGVEESLEKFAEGKADEAIRKLEDLEEKVDGLVDQEEIHHSQEQRIDRALEDLAQQMFFAASSDDD